MIRLKWLKMRAFRSFAEEVRIDFPTSGLVLIRGTSGFGKSTILLAISHALDMCPFPASELQSWYADTDMQVQVGFDSPQGEVVINRGKRNSLKIGDQEPVTGAKAIADGIRKLFGLDADTLQAITYRPQNTSGLFLSLTDGGKKDFLTKILGLDNIEKAVDLSEKSIKDLTPALAAEELAIQQIEADLSHLTQQVVPELQDAVAVSAELEQLRAELAGYDGQIQGVRERAQLLVAAASENPDLLQLRTYLDAIVAKGQEANKANNERHREFQANQELLRRKIQEITRQETTRANIAQQVTGLRQQLQHAQDGKCPTCFRTWEESVLKATQLQGTIDNFNAQLKSLGDFTAERRETELALRQSFSNDPIIEQFRAMQNNYEAQYQQRKLELTMGPQQEAQDLVNAINMKRGVTVSRIKSLGELLSSIYATNTKLEQVRSYQETNTKRLQASLAGRQKIAAKWRDELNAEKDFLALMGRDGFLGVIFEDVLQEIEVEANERIGRLANVSHVTIRFKSEVETNKGTTQKKITPFVYVNGVEARLKSGLSGGMYTSVEGVVDLAVMSVVQRRTGSLPGFLFLDESFNGQDLATKEAAMEVLREYGQEKLVVVIDHSNEFKEMFTQFIDVSFKDGKSGIV